MAKTEVPRKTRGRGTGERAAVQVARKIVAEIRRLKKRPGSKLDAEHLMVERLGVARATVREALRFLELQGALRIKAGPGGGPVVSVPGPEHLASALSLQLQFADASFRAVQEARGEIYPVLAALAAKHAKHQDFQALHASVKRMHESVDDTRALIVELRRFQELIATASGNIVLSLIVGALHRMSEQVGIDIDPKQRRAAVRASERVLAAIEKGDAVEARAATQRMLAAAQRYYDRTAPEALEQPVAWLD